MVSEMKQSKADEAYEERADAAAAEIQSAFKLYETEAAAPAAALAPAYAEAVGEVAPPAKHFDVFSSLLAPPFCSSRVPSARRAVMPR
mmetsp:Transcript_73765/g.123215  ORF Transcript_73765/g.123215 Transcript_73765/m.123215 type:complete len:88 (+) Transcript_73765:68-331(+)